MEHGLVFVMGPSHGNTLDMDSPGKHTGHGLVFVMVPSLLLLSGGATPHACLHVAGVARTTGAHMQSKYTPRPLCESPGPGKQQQQLRSSFWRGTLSSWTASTPDISHAGASAGETLAQSCFCLASSPCCRALAMALLANRVRAAREPTSSPQPSWHTQVPYSYKNGPDQAIQDFPNRTPTLNPPLEACDTRHSSAATASRHRNILGLILFALMI